MSTEPTPAELAAAPPAPEPTPAEIAAQGLPQEVADIVLGKEPEKPAAVTQDKPADISDQKVTENATFRQETAAEAARYDKQLQALMAKAREAREKQVASKSQDEELALLQRIKLAKELGPDAALKALGLERPKIDINKLLNPEKDDEPQSVKELKAQIAQINQALEESKLRTQQEEEQRAIQQRQYWEQNELAGISQFIEKSKDKFEYVGAAKAIGSDKDIYNGMISMYHQGYNPSHEEMADLVESRIEQLLDLLAPTKKFSDFVSKRFGAKLGKGDTVTLTDGLRSEPASVVDLNNMSDDENREYALKAALTAKQEALRKLGIAK